MIKARTKFSEKLGRKYSPISPKIRDFSEEILQLPKAHTAFLLTEAVGTAPGVGNVVRILTALHYLGRRFAICVTRKK